MKDALRHRGPDDWGIQTEGPCTLVNTRLSIVDLSEFGHQPMASPDENLWITYNGEVYNAPELRQELKGYPFRSSSDTEVVLAAYQRWGEDCPTRFIGQFAFAIWDVKKQALFLARDRLGVKPLYYACHKGCFYFASEIKALLVAGVPARPEERVWATYLTHGLYDHSSDTFFHGVEELPAGCRAVTGMASVFSYGRYWDIKDESKLRLSDDEVAEQLLALLQDSLRLCLRSDVPVGLNLSTGLDSNSLLCLMLRGMGVIDLERFSMPETSSAYKDEPGLEMDFWGSLPFVMRSQEAPFGGIATVAYQALHEIIQEQGCKVVLEGQGADEILAGYAYYQSVAQEERYQDGTSHLRPGCVNEDVKALAGPHPKFPRPFDNRLDNALYRDLRYTKLPRVLRMNDHLSMAHGVELREPYLDHRLVEFCFRLPERQKIRDGLGKWLLRHAMKGRLPDPVRLAPKKGDTTPQKEWLRGPLRPYVEEVLSSKEFRERGFFDVATCQKEYNRFCKGEGGNSFWIWQWINTHLWFQTFIEGKV